MMEFNFNIEGGNFSRAGTASSEIKKILKQLNVDSNLIKRIVVALYEAEVNVVAHAWEGNIYVYIRPDAIEVTVADKGPGIPDINLAMQEGYSTASPEVREWDSEQAWDCLICKKTVINSKSNRKSTSVQK